MIDLEAAGGVAYRNQGEDLQVVVIHRRGVWDLPKGTKEAGESIRDCARREVAEEIGIPEPEIIDFLTDTTHQYKRDGKQYRKKTSWFVMEIGQTATFTPQEKEGIDAAQWMNITEAQTKMGFDNLKAVLADFHDWYQQHEEV